MAVYALLEDLCSVTADDDEHGALEKNH